MVAVTLILELFMQIALLRAVFTLCKVSLITLGVGPCRTLECLFIVTLIALAKQRWQSLLILSRSPPEMTVAPQRLVPNAWSSLSTFGQRLAPIT